MRILVIIVMIFVHHEVSSQNKPSYLDSKITIGFSSERTDVALKKIAQEAGFNFSYKSSLIDESRRITVSFENVSVREILDQLFEKKIQYKVRGKYIILTKAPQQKATPKDKAIVTGYVVDEATGERLKDVSVYDPFTLSSAITDSDGYFKIEIKKPTSDDIRLAINKRNYIDTVIVVPSRERKGINIPIHLNKAKVNSLVDSVGSKIKKAWLLAKKATTQAVNMENIDDTIYRRFQFSFVPFIGTNGALSGNVINDVSLNMIGGHSLGVNAVEFGGIFNTVRGDLQGVQFAGMLNGVIGKNKGVQFAGLANAVLDSSRGPQFAGLINFNYTSAEKLQMAGLINYTDGRSKGVMFAGLSNFTLGEQLGPHVSGLFNFSLQDARPAQVAGLFNFTGGNMHGLQLAGLFNYAHDQIRGVQVAGLFNISPKYARGAQIAPLNFAKHIDGTQFGVINVSKSTRGVPIGVISIVGKGYHKVEISADEIFYTNLAFRTGVRQFYNILTVGANPRTFENDSTLWTFGYGIGTAPKLTRWLYLNFDLTSNQIVNGNDLDDLNLLNKFYVGADFQLVKNFSITAGITFNAHLRDYSPVTGQIFQDYTPEIIHHRDIGGKRELNLWWGAKVGLRFF
jgi:hypothetical protein